MTRLSPRPTMAGATFVLALIGSLTAGAARAATEPGSEPPSGDAAFPRTVEHDLGSTEIPAEPLRIVSASVSLTGALLALDAPVVATGTTGSPQLADENGFFNQWADLAIAAELVPLSGPEIDVEEIAAQDPDLIIGTVTGADNIVEAYDQLSALAPTLAYDVSGVSWQDATTEIAEALGLEDNAAAAIATYDDLVAEVSAQIALPSESAIAMVHSPEGTNVFTPESAHGQLLASLGFEVPVVEDSATSAQSGSRSDIVAVSAELLPEAIGDSSVFLVFADDSVIDTLADVEVVAATPPFAEGRVYSLGYESFRLDYYSATQVIERFAELFGGDASAGAESSDVPATTAA